MAVYLYSKAASGPLVLMAATIMGYLGFTRITRKHYPYESKAIEQVVKGYMTGIWIYMDVYGDQIYQEVAPVKSRYLASRANRKGQAAAKQPVLAVVMLDVYRDVGVSSKDRNKGLLIDDTCRYKLVCLLVLLNG